MRLLELKLKIVDRSLPELVEMEDGILYLSTQYQATSHKCPCGCGIEVYLPLADKPVTGTDDEGNFWYGYVNEGLVTLNPSIEIRGGCRSHYNIEKNKIVWL